MIYAWTGKTGSGKTFSMVKEARKAWLKGTDIWSNTVLTFLPEKKCEGNLQEMQMYIDINIVDFPTLFSGYERAKFWLLTKIKPGIMPLRRGKIRYFEDISEILEARNGLILFDEAQVLFNARLWESLPNEFQYKLQQSRKHALDLFCTTQNLGTIDITYRRLIHGWYHCEASFGFLGFNLHRLLIKDVDEIYNTVDDLKATTLKSKLFLIHRFSPAYYDTLYDIGFKRFKVQCVSLYEYSREKKKLIKQQVGWIIPKKMSLENASRTMRLYQSLCMPKKSTNSFKNSKSYATNT